MGVVASLIANVKTAVDARANAEGLTGGFALDKKGNAGAGVNMIPDDNCVQVFMRGASRGRSEYGKEAMQVRERDLVVRYAKHVVLQKGYGTVEDQFTSNEARLIAAVEKDTTLPTGCHQVEHKDTDIFAPEMLGQGQDQPGVWVMDVVFNLVYEEVF